MWYPGIEIANRPKMQRLALGIIALVGVFVVLVAATLVAKSRTAVVEPSGPNPSKADLQIKEVDIEEQSGTVRWRLKAEQALVYDAEKRTTLRKIAVDVYDKDRSWTIVGDEGDVVQATPRSRNVEVRNNVIVTSSDGMRLETSVLRWDGERKRLWTDAPVRLSRDKTVIHGSAFELLMADEAATVSGRVHATFETGDSSSDGRTGGSRTARNRPGTTQ